MLAGVLEKLVPLALVPNSVPPVETSYHLILLPAETAFKLTSPALHTEEGVAVTEDGAAAAGDTVTVALAVFVQLLSLV